MAPLINSPRRSALTLLETLIALTLIGAALLALFTSLQACSAAARHACLLTRAVLLAETKLADLQTLERPTLTTQQDAAELFTWQVQLAPTAMENLAAVKITVSWREQQRPQRFELLSLLIIKPFTQRS